MSFQKEFMLPLLEINKNGRIPIFVDKDHIYSLVKGDSDNILYITYNPISITDPIDRFNVNLLKLNKGLTCIKTDNFSELVIDKNYLEYADDSIKFNVKLLASNTIADCPKIKPESIKSHPIDGTITIPNSYIKDIIKAKNFAIDSNKVYIEQSGNDAVFEFGDRETDHKDNIRITIPDSVTGDITTSIYETSIFDLIHKAKSDIVMKMGQRALIIEINQIDSCLTYLTPKLKK